jgi:hypothetical protein
MPFFPGHVLYQQFPAGTHGFRMVSVFPEPLKPLTNAIWCWLYHQAGLEWPNKLTWFSRVGACEHGFSAREGLQSDVAVVFP